MDKKGAIYMIITVTMNPAIDKTVEIERLETGGLNRIQSIELDVGGKGINVSKTIQKLGGKTIATGFLGGSGGKTVEKVLQDYKVSMDFVMVDGETRTNMKVVETNGEVTELNEPGPLVTQEQVECLIQKLEGYANEETLFVLAGSIPAGVEKTIYRTIIQRLHRKKAHVLLDADGELLFHALEEKPEIIKPNRIELEGLFQMDYRATEKELLEMGEKLLKKGIQRIAISLGQMGAIFLTKEKKIKCRGLSIKAHSTVGAGDAMVAALAYGWDNKMSIEEYVTLSMAASAGAVTTIGTKPPAKELIEELKSQVELEEC